MSTASIADESTGNARVLKVDEEFRTLIPQSTSLEVQQLRLNLQRDGCLDPICVWNDVILDGHTRYKLCQELGIPFRVKKIAMKDRDQAEEWIIHHQFGRRNLLPADRVKLARRLEQLIQNQAKAVSEEKKQRDKDLSKATPNGNGLHGEMIETAEKKPGRPKKDGPQLRAAKEASAKAGISEGSYHKGKKVLEEAPETVKEAYETGKMSTDQAYKTAFPESKSSKKARKAAEDLKDAGAGANGDFREPGEDAPEDEDSWLLLLPLFHGPKSLGSEAKKNFRSAALLYHRMAKIREQVRAESAEAFKGLTRKNEVANRLVKWLTINDPKAWKRCLPPEQGGCGGEMRLPGLDAGECPLCHGQGFTIEVRRPR